MGILTWVSTRLRLDQATPIPTALILGTGGGLILAARQFQPPRDEVPLWLVWWLVAGCGGVLLAYGVLMVGSMVVRSGQFARAFGSRLRFQRPVYVAPLPGEQSNDPPKSGELLTATVSASHMVLPGPPRLGLSAEQAITGWEHDRTRLLRAVDFAIAWLYRREHWPSLSEAGRTNEPAPSGAWASAKYEQLGMQHITYEPPDEVPPEPGWTSPDLPTTHRAESVRFYGGGEARPPLAAALREEAWDIARPEFCELMNVLVVDGRELVALLLGLPATSPHDEGVWNGPVSDWILRVKRFQETYFGDVTHLEGQAALPPAWRQEYVSAVSSRLEWLEASIVPFKCYPEGDIV